MKKMIFLFLLSLFVLSLSNVKVKDEFNYNENGIFPLKIGNKWVYENKYYNNLDSVLRIKELTTEIIGDTLIQNIKYYIKKSKSFKYLSRNDEEGYHITTFNCFDTKKFYNHDILTYKYPCNIDDFWILKENMPYLNGSSTCTVVSLNKNINVPYGKFECIQFEQLLKHIDVLGDTVYTLNVSYVKPSIGLIKLEFLTKTNNEGIYQRKMTSELKDIFLK